MAEKRLCSSNSFHVRKLCIRVDLVASGEAREKKDAAVGCMSTRHTEAMYVEFESEM